MPTIVIQPDESTGVDAVISQVLPDTPDPNPVPLILLADSGASNKESSLFVFDVSVVPAGSTIDSATFTLFNISGPADDHAFRCARLTQTWTEDEVTWNSYETGNVWPGGSGAEADLDLTDAETGTALDDTDLEFTMTPLVQDALDDRAGVLDILIHVTDTSTTGGAYHSSASPAKGLRPMLTIVYTEAAPPVGEPPDYRNHPIRRDRDEKRGFDGREIL